MAEANINMLAGMAERSTGNILESAQDKGVDRKWMWEEDGCRVYRGTCRTAPGCHDHCGILMYVKDGKLEKIEGDPDNPYNQGRVCPRCLAAKDMIYNKDRLIHPMKRDPKDRGKDCFEKITWEEAFDLIDENFTRIIEKYGWDAIICKQGTGRDINGYTQLMSAYLGNNSFGLAFQSGNSCYLPRSLMASFKMGYFPIADLSQFWYDRYDNPQWKVPSYILVWGCNPVFSNSDGSLGHWAVECRKRGSEYITIDPRLTWMASKSKIWIPIRPGTDGALALAMNHVIVEEGLIDEDFISRWTYGFDEYAQYLEDKTPEWAAEICDVPVDLIYEAAREVGKAERVALYWGVSVDMTHESAQGSAAILDMMALTGNIEKPGTITRGTKMSETVSMIGQAEWTEIITGKPLKDSKLCYSYEGKEYPINKLVMPLPDAEVETMETGEPFAIKGSWLQATNPVSCMGNDPERVLKALRGLEYNVMVDCFMTPTIMGAADLVLPAEMFCERTGVTGFSAYTTYLGAMVPAIEAPGECKSDQQIIIEAGQRLRKDEITHPFETDVDLYNEAVLDKAGITYEQLRDRVMVWPHFEYNKQETGGLRADGQPGFETPTGRYEFYSTMFEAYGYSPFGEHVAPTYGPESTPDLMEEYPLILSTGARVPFFFHSEHRQAEHLRALHPDPVAEMNPKTAEKYGLQEGDWAYVENQFGKVKMRVKLIPMREDVVQCDHGWWFPEKDPEDLYGVFESNVNQLIPFNPGQTGFGNDCKATICKVYKA